MLTKKMNMDYMMVKLFLPSLYVLLSKKIYFFLSGTRNGETEAFVPPSKTCKSRRSRNGFVAYFCIKGCSRVNTIFFTCLFVLTIYFSIETWS